MYNENDFLTWTDEQHPFSSAKKRLGFKSPYDDERKHNGRPFKILGLSDKNRFEMNEVGAYFRIQFEDGEIIDADPIEIYENVGMVGGEWW